MITGIAGAVLLYAAVGVIAWRVGRGPGRRERFHRDVEWAGLEQAGEPWWLTSRRG